MATILQNTTINGSLTAQYIESVNGISGSLHGNADTATSASIAAEATSLNSGIDYSVNKISVLSDAHVNGNLVVDQNLTVKGDLTYMGTQDLRVKDKTIELGYVESGSGMTPDQADGAGIVIGNAGENQVASITYKSSTDSIVFDKQIEGEITNAISASRSVSAEHADAAGKVDNKLTVKGDGIATAVTFDGSSNQEVVVDMTSLLAGTRASASAALSAFSASQATKDAAQDKALTDTASAIRSELSSSVSEINSTIGEVPEGSTVVSMIEAASSGSSAEAEKIHEEIGDKPADSEIVATTLWGAIEEVSDNLNSVSASVSSDLNTESNRAKQAEEAISGSLASHIGTYNQFVQDQANKDQSQDEALATEVSRSQAAEQTLTTNLATEVSRSKAAEKVLTDNLAAEELRAKQAEEAISASLSSHIGTYDQFVEDQAARDEAQDTALANTASAIRSELSSSVSQINGNINSLSGSVAATTLAISNSLTAESNRAKAAEAAIFASASAYSSSAATALSNYSASQATKDAAQDKALTDTASAIRSEFATADSKVAATASANLASAVENLEGQIEALDTKCDETYVKHAGDTMTGDLTMSNADIVFTKEESSARVVYNKDLNAIEFVFE